MTLQGAQWFLPPPSVFCIRVHLFGFEPQTFYVLSKIISNSKFAKVNVVLALPGVILPVFIPPAHHLVLLDQLEEGGTVLILVLPDQLEVKGMVLIRPGRLWWIKVTLLRFRFAEACQGQGNSRGYYKTYKITTEKSERIWF